MRKHKGIRFKISVKKYTTKDLLKNIKNKFCLNLVNLLPGWRLVKQKFNCSESVKIIFNGGYVVRLPIVKHKICIFLFPPREH